MLKGRVILKTIAIALLIVIACGSKAGAVTVLWAGGEDIDFPAGGAVSIQASRHAGYSRFFIDAASAPLVSTPFPGGAVTSCWLGFTYWWGGANGEPALAGLTKSGEGAHGLYLIMTVNTHYLSLRKYNGSSWTTLATSKQDISTGTHRIDMRVQNFGANATVDVYYDSSVLPFLTYTGDVTVAGVSDVDAVGVFGWYNEGLTMAEFVVADADTRALSVVTYSPSAAGDTNDWTGAYTDIDENAITDTDTVYTNTDAKDAQFNLTDGPAGNFSVVGIKIASRLTSTADAAVKTVKLGVKSGGTVDVDAGHLTTTGWATYERIAHTINGSPLTKTLLDALQVDLRSAP